MKLSNQTVMKFVKGAVFCFERDGYLNASCYSKDQIAMMQAPSYDRGWRNRSVFTGGVRLEFRTDAELLSFDYRASDRHERSNTVDLYIDGTLTAVYEIGDRLKGKVEFQMPAGRKTVTVYYPCESRFEIKHFTIDGGYQSVKDKGPRLLILGDSITQGAGPQIASAAYLHGLT